MLSHGNLVSNAMNVAPCTGYESDATYLDAAPIFHLSDGCSTYGITMAEELDQYGAAGIHKIFQRLEPGHETRGVASSEQMTGAYLQRIWRPPVPRRLKQRSDIRRPCGRKFARYRR